MERDDRSRRYPSAGWPVGSMWRGLAKQECRGVFAGAFRRRGFGRCSGTGTRKPRTTGRLSLSTEACGGVRVRESAGGHAAAASGLQMNPFDALPLLTTARMHTPECRVVCTLRTDAYGSLCASG
jgi:hypothetical protein